MTTRYKILGELVLWDGSLPLSRDFKRVVGGCPHMYHCVSLILHLRFNAYILLQLSKSFFIIINIICNKIWKTGEWPTTWTQSLVITLPKKGNLQLCQNYITISLISHTSKVMLKIILNRLQSQAEEIIAEEQAGFRAGRSTTEQIFNLRILCEKYLQHQQNLYHVFIDFTKAFHRVWHEALWATMRKYNINASIIRAIENL